MVVKRIAEKVSGIRMELIDVKLQCNRVERYGYRFFFFKQKTAYEIGTGDWSSDVCSSDL